MSAPTATANSYDELPYPSQPLVQSQPERLAAIALLFGLSPAPADRARVLELGCGIGGNLIPLAERDPQGTFVGVDYSLVQVAEGRRNIELLGLRNVELLHASIADLGPEIGKFDYIICHGVYSWVSPDLQDAILAVCQQALAPQGVAFVSYNLYPGWYFRSIIRDVLLEHTSANLSPIERLRASRRLLEFLQKACARDSAPFARLLKTEIELTLSQNEGYIFHEYLERENYPYSFDVFLDRAARYDLQYLSDAAPATMFAANFGPQIEQNVLAIAPDMVSAEMHLDALRNRAFRQSLLCHADQRVDHQLTVNALDRLYFSAQLNPVNAALDLKSPTVEKFATPQGLSLSTPTPAAKATMLYLGRQWPRCVSLEQLFAGAEQLLAAAGLPPELTQEQRLSLRHNLVQCIASGLLDIGSLPDRFVTTIGARPAVGSFARLEARDSNAVTNRRHELVKLDQVCRNLLPMLDGQRTRAELLAGLVTAAERGELSVLVGGMPVSRGAEATHALEITLNQALATLANNALLAS